MEIPRYNQVFHRRFKVVKVEAAMGVEPPPNVQQNPFNVYTRRRRLKPSCTSQGDTHDEDQCNKDILADSIGGQAVAEPAEVGPISRKRPRSPAAELELDPSTPPDNFSKSIIGLSQESTIIDDDSFSKSIIRLSQESTITDDERVVSDENAQPEDLRYALRPRKRSCRRSLYFSEEIWELHDSGNEVVSPLCKYGCLREIRRMESILSCRRKRIQKTRIRKSLLLAHWMISSLPRYCKRKRSSRQKSVKICWSALISYRSSKIDKKTSDPRANEVPSSDAPTGYEVPSSVAPKKTPKKPSRARIRKTTKSLAPDCKEVPNSATPKRAPKEAKKAPKEAKKAPKEAISQKIKKSKKKDELDFLDMDVEAATEILVQKLKSLKIDDGIESGVIVPYKPKLKPLKVLLDEQTLKVWNKTMFPEDEEGLDPDEEDQWNNERELFNGRVKSFIAKMRLTQGPRRFMPWKSSVVDSIVGVFLTQNVSDILSSNAYLSLCAKFPAQSSKNVRAIENEGWMLEDKLETRKEVVWNGTQESHEKNDEGSILKPKFGISQQEIMKIEEVGDKVLSSGSSSVEEMKTPSASINGRAGIEETAELKTPQKEKPKEKKKKADKKVPVDWKSLRETIMKLFAHEPRSEDHMDTVDWEKVRTVHQDVLADTIKDRGQQNELARKIQEFLNRLISMQGSIDLEWLRHCPPLKVKDYLLEVNGLGLKSVECVRLLALQHVAFPVDVNVGRIAVRLGWVPLEPMAEIQFHLLDKYPAMDEIQKYLWPRLCAMDQQTLYELHYQLITFGKIFCTKRKPNCQACPLKGECRYFASVHASANALPAPVEAASTNPVVAKNSSICQSGSIEVVAGGYSKHACEPIIEIPDSPVRHSSEDLSLIDGITSSPCSENQSLSLLEMDIEDLCKDDWIPAINLSSRKSKASKSRRINPEDSKALVVLPPEVASYPMPKLKAENRLRTEHQVYELPDGHPLIAEFEPRVPDDPCPYLLAIWPDESSSIHEGAIHVTEETKIETIRGSVLIPCRTATGARFPLNGTYFQVNEVFADDRSSKHPIDVPRDLIWNLTRRMAYAGTSASSIFKWKSLADISGCFRRGFICVRGFDRMTRYPKDLDNRFHESLKYKAQQKGPSLRRKNVENEQKDQSPEKKKEAGEVKRS